MKSTIYLVEDDELIAIEEEKYDSENLLQKSLAEHSRLLAGDQVNPDNPRQWLLIERESDVPDEEEGSARWSIDHLFLDQDGVPTFVEVKRSTDTRIRRKVVGQMLDYVSNASKYWGEGRMRTRFETRCESGDKNPEEVIKNEFSEDIDAEAFWGTVESNLRSGKIRLLFVADEIPSELKRIVEFLNEQMDPAEVLALEVKQYAGEGQKALVPRIIGQTEEARRKKGTSSQRKQWDEPSFLEDIEVKLSEGTISEEEAEVIRKIYSFAKEEADEIKWGTGSVRASFTPRWDAIHDSFGLFTIRTNGKIEMWQPGTLVTEREEEIDWAEKELRGFKEKLDEINEWELSFEDLEKGGGWAKTSIGVLTSEEDREKFQKAVLDFVQACKEA